MLTIDTAGFKILMFVRILVDMELLIHHFQDVFFLFVGTGTFFLALPEKYSISKIYAGFQIFLWSTKALQKSLFPSRYSSVMMACSQGSQWTFASELLNEMSEARPTGEWFFCP